MDNTPIIYSKDDFHQLSKVLDNYIASQKEADSGGHYYLHITPDSKLELTKDEHYASSLEDIKSLMSALVEQLDEKEDMSRFTVASIKEKISQFEHLNTPPSAVQKLLTPIFQNWKSYFHTSRIVNTYHYYFDPVDDNREKNIQFKDVNTQNDNRNYGQYIDPKKGIRSVEYSQTGSSSHTKTLEELSEKDQPIDANNLTDAFSKALQRKGLDQTGYALVQGLFYDLVNQLGDEIEDPEDIPGAVETFQDDLYDRFAEKLYETDDHYERSFPMSQDTVKNGAQAIREITSSDTFKKVLTSFLQQSLDDKRAE
jgi:hypothetical protein